MLLEGIGLNQDVTLTVTHHTSHIVITPVTISKKGNYISSDAHFSGFLEYTGLMIYGSFLIEKNAKYCKRCGAI
jgi:hypothetical protein